MRGCRACGHVQPTSAADPGLVFDAGFNDWLAFICNTQPAGLEATCNGLWGAGFPADPSDLNIASIAIGALGGAHTVTRTVTNVGASAETYAFSYTGLAGFTVSANPANFSIPKGGSQEIEIAFVRTTATLNTYTGGQIYLTGDKGHVVRVPVVIVPVALAAPAQVSGNGGAFDYDVTFGYTGAFTATPRGLVPAVTTDGTVADDPTDSTCSLASPNAQLIPVNIPAGTTCARFSLFDADVAPGADIDLCVFRRTTLVGFSGSGTSAEEVNLLNPIAAAYTVVVQGWGVAGSSPFKLHTLLLDSAAAGNMTVTAPASATTATTGTINLTFSGCHRRHATWALSSMVTQPVCRARLSPASICRNPFFHPLAGAGQPSDLCDQTKGARKRAPF